MTRPQLQPGRQLRELTVEGRERSYLLHLPQRSPDSGDRWPVVLAFHGSGTNAEIMRQFSGLDEKANEAGFVVVFPNGSGRAPEALAFNVGGNYGFAGRQKIDDVRFTAALLDDLATLLPIDPNRIFATGMSNGGILSYRLATELADRVSAVAPVGGPMGIWEATPSRPVAVCHFHGTADEHVPYAGGIGMRSLSKINFRSAQDSVNQWIAWNGCHPDAEVSELPALIDDGTHATRYVYRGGRKGVEVMLYALHGMGHTWPGREPLYPNLGATTHNLIANDAIWEFFQRHGRKAD